MNSFVKQFIAFVTGDDAEVRAQQTLRKATAALNSQISEFEGELVDLEESLISANEGLKNARINNGELIHDRNKYVSDLIDAKNNVQACEEAVTEHKNTLEFLKNELKNVKAEG